MLGILISVFQNSFFFRFQPKYLNVLFLMVLVGFLLSNIFFVALKIVREQEIKEGVYGENKVFIISLFVNLLKAYARLPTEDAGLFCIFFGCQHCFHLSF